MNLWNLLMLKLRAAFTVHEANAAAHHAKYTDAEVDAIVAVHTAISAAHHTKYSDADAVAAIAAADDYVKNIGDTMTGQLTIQDPVGIRSNLRIENVVVGGQSEIKCIGERSAFRILGYNVNDFGYIQGGKKDGSGVGGIIFSRFGSGANMQLVEFHADVVDFTNGLIKNPKNHVHSAVSGVKKLVEIDIGGTSYYLEVYPTKA